jgi:hypothetical protein
MEKKILFGIIALCILGLVAFLWMETKPKPGTEVEDLGRGHVAIGTTVEYNSNPPTSGPHFEQWTKWGVLDTPRDDRNLVHSLEHGYVIISYNCDFRASGSLFFKSAFAQEMTGQMTSTDSAQEASTSADLPESFNSPDCQDLKNKLKEIFDAKGQTRLIVVPRPNLDAKIAVSSWRYFDKFNEFDRKRIENFISAHINQGPEKTIE